MTKNKKGEASNASKDGSSKQAARVADRTSLDRVFPTLEYQARVTASVTMPLADAQFILAQLPPLCGMFGTRSASHIATNMPVWVRVASISGDVLNTELHVNTQRGDIRIFTLENFCEQLSPQKQTKKDGPLEKLSEFYLIHPMQMRTDTATVMERNLFNLLANPYQTSSVLESGVHITRAYVSLFELLSFTHACIKMYDVEDGEFGGDKALPIDLLKGICRMLQTNFTNAPMEPFRPMCSSTSEQQQQTFFVKSWNASNGEMDSLFMIDEALQLPSLFDDDIMPSAALLSCPSTPLPSSPLRSPYKVTPRALCPERSELSSPRKTLGPLLPTNLFPVAKRAAPDVGMKVLNTESSSSTSSLTATGAFCAAAAAASASASANGSARFKYGREENPFGLFDMRS